MRSLDDLVKRKLIEYEASKQNLSVDDFLNIYVCRAMQDSAMAGVADMPAKKLRGRLIQRLVDSLFYEAQITRYIYPPKMPSCVITDLNIRYRGNLDAKTYLIVASDFDCQRCGEFEKTLKRIYNEYKSKVKLGFVNFADEPTFASLACEAAINMENFGSFTMRCFHMLLRSIQSMCTDLQRIWEWTLLPTNKTYCRPRLIIV